MKQSSLTGYLSYLRHDVRNSLSSRIDDYLWNDIWFEVGNPGMETLTDHLEDNLWRDVRLAIA